jgi:hypothetical protein
MHSVGEQIVAKIAELLNAPADKPLLTVRQRPCPLSAEDYDDGTKGIDAFLLYALKESSQRESLNRVLRERNIRIEIPVSGPPPLDEVADPLYLFIVNALFTDDAQSALASVGMADGTQGKFWMEEVGLIWETVSSYVDMSVCVLELKFTFATTTDPSVRV